MSKRYTFTTPYKDAYEIVDRDIDKAMKPEDVAYLLNRQNQRIAELEEQLKKSQKQLAISELEKLKDFFLEPYGDEKMSTEFLITTKNTGKIAEYVLDRIKSLKGE